MKFRLILDDKEILVITEDGGIVCIREAESSSNITAITDYYQTRLTEKGITSDNVFEILSEGKMYCKDWEIYKFNNINLIQNALSWLNPTEPESNWELVDDIFTDIFGPL